MPELVFIGAVLAFAGSAWMALELRKVSKGFQSIVSVLEAPPPEREWLKDLLNVQTGRMKRQDEQIADQADRLEGLSRGVESMTRVVEESRSKDREIDRLVRLYEDQLGYLRHAAMRNIEFEKHREDPQAQTASAGTVREPSPPQPPAPSRFSRVKQEPGLYRPPAPVTISVTSTQPQQPE